jgi:hypothetical protein
MDIGLEAEQLGQSNINFISFKDLIHHSNASTFPKHYFSAKHVTKEESFNKIFVIGNGLFTNYTNIVS